MPPSHTTEIKDVELLRLVAEIAGLDAIALIVQGDTGPVLRAGWPLDGAERPLPDVAAETLAALLRELGGAGGPIVTSTLPVDPDVEAVLTGSLAAFPDAERAAAARAIEGLGGLLAARLGLESARRRAEDAHVRMAGLVETGMALGRAGSLDDLLARVVESAREVLGARYAALGVLDESGTELASFVTAGISAAQREAIGALPRGRGLLGALIRDAQPLRIARIADDPRSAGFPPHHPPMESFLGVPVALRGEVYGNLYLTDKVGGPFTAEDEQIALTYAAQVAIAVDNLRNLEEQRRRTRELESVMEVTRAMMATRELDSLLPLVARRARRLAGADTVGVAIVEDGHLVFRYAHGLDALALEAVTLPVEVDELAESLRARLGTTNVNVSLLEVGGVVAGALAAVAQRPFDARGLGLLEAFAHQAAIAVANAEALRDERVEARRAAAQLASRERERAAEDAMRRAVEAQESERARVARELHDEAGQILTALTLHLKALEDDVGPGRVRERLAGMRTAVGEASANLRELATRLRPAALFDRGLAGAIEELASHLRDAGIAVDVDVRGVDAQTRGEVQTVLFRVVQEALTNVARHSGARHASVLAAIGEGHLRLVIEDDGCGFDPMLPTSRLGVAGIRERVEMLGGELRIESAEGAGTAVVVDLELNPESPGPS